METTDRWITVVRAADLMNAQAPPEARISLKSARRRLAALDAEAQRSGYRILRRFGPRTTLVNADALMELLHHDTSHIAEDVLHLHSRFDAIEKKTTRNRQGIRQLRKQLRELSDRLDGMSRKVP